MGKPSNQQIADARKRGIVPGARIKCAIMGEGVAKPYSKWRSDERGLNDGVLWFLFERKWSTVIAAPAKRKTTTQPRIKGCFAAKSAPRKRAAKPKEPTLLEANRERMAKWVKQLDAKIADMRQGIDQTIAKLSAIESSVAVLRSGASFMQQLEQDAPKPVEAPAEVRVPKAGDWVVVVDNPWGPMDTECPYRIGDIGKVERRDSVHAWLTSKGQFPEGVCVADSCLRPATEADLAAEEARRKEAERAEKVAKLGFGVRVKQVCHRDIKGLYLYPMDGPLHLHLIAWEGAKQPAPMLIDQFTILP